jgi:hypothetical protein
LQVQIRRAFAVREVLTSSEIYDSCYAKRRVAGLQIDRPYRWSVLRILRVLADQIGRAPTAGRPWIWRLRNSLLPADTCQPIDTAKEKQDAEWNSKPGVSGEG